MKHWTKMFVALAASAAFASLVAALAVASGTKAGGARVAVAKSTLGRILVDSRGITLYDFPKDRGTTSSCYGACAALWPPLTTKVKPVAGRGVRASLLGTTKRKDGKLEVTYNGHPLYYFVTDRKPGQTTGQGLNQFGAPGGCFHRRAKRSTVASAHSRGPRTEVAGEVARYLGALSILVVGVIHAQQ